jgi:hypothetical protein
VRVRSDLPQPDRDDIEDVLRDICLLRHDHAIDRTAPWDTIVDVAEIRAPVDGGRSGATVLDVDVTRTRDSRQERLIVKIDSAEKIAEEWRAVQRIARDWSSRMFVPVLAVSGFIEDENRTRLIGQRAALVYAHVGELSSYSEEPVVSLEELVRDEGQDSGQVTRVIGVLGRELRHRLWGNEARGRRPLDPLNRELGVDLVLEVEHAGPRTLSFGELASGRRQAAVRNSRDILRAATSLEHPGTTSLAVGSIVEVRGITADVVRPDRMVGILGSVSIEVRRADGASRVDFTDHIDKGARDIVVVGRVKDVRTLSWWRRIGEHDQNVVIEADALKVSGIRVGQPFARLTALITEEAPLRTIGLTHGDLNPRNILVGGGLVYAIDFARAGDRPPLIDLAWLEVCLLRDVYGPTMEMRRLVRLQRLLGLTARLVDSMPESWDPATWLGPADAEVAGAFRVIWAVRSAARAWYRAGNDPPGWWKDYLAHLTMAALGTLKFRQNKASVHAVLAAAGVAAEWLGGRPYRYWLEPELRQAAAQVIPAVDADGPEAGDVLAEVLAAVDYVGIADDPTREAVEAARDRCVAAWYSGVATEVLGRDDAGVYIALRAIQGRPADSPKDLDALGERYPSADARRPAADATTTTSDTHGREGTETARPRPLDLLDARDAIELATRGGRHAVVVLLGEAGSGKTAVARELQRRHARALLGAKTGSRPPDDLPPMVPVALTAAQVDAAIRTVGAATRVRRIAGSLLEPVLGGNVDAALRLGGVHVMIHGFDVLDPTAYGRVAEWVRVAHETYRRTRVVICHRTYGFDPEELPFTTLALQEVSEQEAREYIRNRFKTARPADYEEATEELMRALSRDDVRESIRELAQTPRFLAAMTDWYLERGHLPTHPRDLVSGLTERYLRERLQSMQPSPADFTYETCVAALEALAGRLLDQDMDEATVLVLFAEHTDRPTELLNLLVGAGLVTRAGVLIRFHRRIFHQYFAASVEIGRADDIDALKRRLLSYRGRAALEVTIRFADGARDLVHQLLDTALKADPVFAARLLRWTDDPYHQDVTRFLYEQEQTLFGRGGPHAWSAAVNALHEFGTVSARHVLHTIARSGDAEPAARSAALTGLLRLRGITPIDLRADADRALTTTVRRLLDGPTPQALRVRAINAVVDARLTSLVAYLAGLLDGQAPWPILRAARRGLASLDQILEPRQRATYVAACARRLAECEAERMTAIEGRVVEELQDERWELIEVLSRAGRLDLVLPTRFSFEPSEHFYPAQTRRLTAARRSAVPDVAQPAWDVLHGDHSPAALIELFATGDDLVAVAAAHRVLAEHPDDVAQLLRPVSAASSAQKLLVVAETVPLLGEDGLKTVRAIGTELIDAIPDDRVMTDDRLEALAALLAGLPANKRSTRRLRLQMMIKLRDTRPTLAHGPLERVFLESERWSDREVSNVVLTDAAGRDLVLRGLSLVLYPNDARQRPPITLTPPAEQAILGYQPETAADRVALVRACTSAGLVDGLELALAAAEDPETATLTGLSTHLRYGAETVWQLGEVLTCIGYLGRQAHEADDVERSGRATSFLRAFDTSGQDRTVERGRLLGLALLGDWHPLLGALWPGDRPMHRAARNAVLVWRPGPFTPEWGRDDEAVARHIGDRLAREGSTLAPDVRSNLAEIKGLVERQLGSVVLSDRA